MTVSLCRMTSYEYLFQKLCFFCQMHNIKEYEKQFKLVQNVFSQLAHIVFY